MPSFVRIQVNEPLPMSPAAIWSISSSHEFLVAVQQPKINSSPRLDCVCMLAWTWSTDHLPPAVAVAWRFRHRVHCMTSTYSKTWMHIRGMKLSRSALLQNIIFKCSAVRQRLLKVQSYASVTDLQLFNWCHFSSFSLNCKYLLFRKCTSECSRCFPAVWAPFHKCHVYSFEAWAE